MVECQNGKYSIVIEKRKNMPRLYYVHRKLSNGELVNTGLSYTKPAVDRIVKWFKAHPKPTWREWQKILRKRSM